MLKDIFMDLLLIVGIAFLGLIFSVIVAQIVDTIKTAISRKRVLKAFEQELIKQLNKEIRKNIKDFTNTRDN